MWYRIELNKDGSVASCTEVEACVLEGRNVRYVEANSKFLACVLVQKWWKNRAQENRREKKMADRRFQAGLCKCGATAKPGRQRCPGCQARSAQLKREVRAGRAPLHGYSRTDAERAQAAFRRQESLKKRNDSRYEKAKQVAGASNPKKARRIALEQALAKFDQLTVDAYRAWLVREIQAVTPKIGAYSVLKETLEQHHPEAE
jgi:hypothetical protein